MQYSCNDYWGEAQEWFDAASGYSKDDNRYDECMKKYHELMTIASKLNTKEYAKLSVEANELEYKIDALENALALDEDYNVWTKEEYETLCAMRKSAISRLRELFYAMKEYREKIGV